MRWKLIVDSTPVRVIRRILGERDYRGAWPEVRDLLRQSWAKIFASQGGAQPWRPLSRETLRWRKEIGAAGRPMLDIDAAGRPSLKASVLGGDGTALTVRREFMEIGTSLGYAGLHQFGAEIRQPLRSQKARKAFAPAGELIKRIPARPFLTQAGTVGEPELDDHTAGQIAESFAESLARKLAAAFGGA